MSWLASPRRRPLDAPPLSIVESCKYDFSVIAAISAMKFAFHMPTYRQQDWFASAVVPQSLDGERLDQLWREHDRFLASADVASAVGAADTAGRRHDAPCCYATLSTGRTGELTNAAAFANRRTRGSRRKPVAWFRTSYAWLYTAWTVCSVWPVHNNVPSASRKTLLNKWFPGFSMDIFSERHTMSFSGR